MSKYIDADQIRTEIKQLKEKYPSWQLKLAMDDLHDFIDSIQQDETQVDKMLCSQVWWEEQGWIMIPPDATVEGIESLLKQVRKKLQQEQPTIEEDWVEKRKQECMCRRLSANGNYQCERYEGVLGPCDGRCSWVIDYPKLKELEEMKQPEVDLEKEIKNERTTLLDAFGPMNGEQSLAIRNFAHYFYELGLKARK